MTVGEISWNWELIVPDLWEMAGTALAVTTSTNSKWVYPFIFRVHCRGNQCWTADERNKRFWKRIKGEKRTDDPHCPHKESWRWSDSIPHLQRSENICILQKIQPPSDRRHGSDHPAMESLHAQVRVCSSILVAKEAHLTDKQLLLVGKNQLSKCMEKKIINVLRIGLNWWKWFCCTTYSISMCEH